MVFFTIFPDGSIDPALCSKPRNGFRQTIKPHDTPIITTRYNNGNALCKKRRPIAGLSDLPRVAGFKVESGSIGVGKGVGGGGLGVACLSRSVGLLDWKRRSITCCTVGGAIGTYRFAEAAVEIVRSLLGVFAEIAIASV
jgi:hypothetical protein